MHEGAAGLYSTASFARKQGDVSLDKNTRVTDMLRSGISGKSLQISRQRKANLSF